MTGKRQPCIAGHDELKSHRKTVFAYVILCADIEHIDAELKKKNSCNVKMNNGPRF